MKVSNKGFVCCPECSRSTKTKVHRDTILYHFPLFCPWCKKEYIINHKPEPRASADA